jgi:hypothetical protein
MVTRFAAIGTVSFALFLACGAECQNVRASLPDAPSTPVPIRAEQSKTEASKTEQSKTEPSRGFAEQMHSPSKAEGGFAVAHEEALRQEWSGMIRGNNTTVNDMDPKGIFHKYLFPSSTRQGPGHPADNEGGWVARAERSASRMIMTRDDSGKIRLNTPYLLRTLTYVAKDTASTPYWRRSPGEPASDFGATIGDDAGMNVFHEFAPSIQQLMKSHAPRFVAKIAQRVGHK